MILIRFAKGLFKETKSAIIREFGGGKLKEDVTRFLNSVFKTTESPIFRELMSGNKGEFFKPIIESLKSAWQIITLFRAGYKEGVELAKARK